MENNVFLGDDPLNLMKKSIDLCQKRANAQSLLNQFPPQDTYILSPIRSHLKHSRTYQCAMLETGHRGSNPKINSRSRSRSIRKKNLFIVVAIKTCPQRFKPGRDYGSPLDCVRRHLATCLGKTSSIGHNYLHFCFIHLQMRIFFQDVSFSLFLPLRGISTHNGHEPAIKM
ncbi:hypothetical protein CEXT_803461, partial [Caerostris extrusa]